MLAWTDHVRVLILGGVLASALLFIAPGPQPLFAGTCQNEICTNTRCHMGTANPDDFSSGYWVDDFF